MFQTFRLNRSTCDIDDVTCVSFKELSSKIDQPLNAGEIKTVQLEDGGGVGGGGNGGNVGKSNNVKTKGGSKPNTYMSGNIKYYCESDRPKKRVASQGSQADKENNCINVF